MIEYKWVGEWFTPFVGERYTVPLTAANYGDLRGKTGTCIRFFQSTFGHVWALLEIGGEFFSVRTCYLHPVAEDGTRLKLVEDLNAEDEPLEKFAYVWKLPDNSGTTLLRTT